MCHECIHPFVGALQLYMVSTIIYFMSFTVLSHIRFEFKNILFPHFFSETIKMSCGSLVPINSTIPSRQEIVEGLQLIFPMIHHLEDVMSRYVLISILVIIY